MNDVTCEECRKVIFFGDDWMEDESGTYHDECYQTVSERSKP